jgi:hypothetical protein
MDLERIIEAIGRRRLRITDHADEEATADALSLDEIFESAIRGEIIEEYPTDWLYPSCLILGFTESGAPVHSVWAYNESTASAVLITVYRPDPARWINWRQRRPPG